MKTVIVNLVTSSEKQFSPLNIIIVALLKPSQLKLMLENIMIKSNLKCKKILLTVGIKSG